MKHQDNFNEEIKRIFVNGVIKPIKWGGENSQEWDSWTVHEKLEFAMELASAMNQAADLMQQDRNALIETTKIAQLNLVNAEAALTIQRNIVVNSLTGSNLEKQNYIKKIHTLEATLVGKNATIELLNNKLADS